MFIRDQGTGAPILLLHGQPGWGGDLAPLWRRLREHRVLVPDRPGYGSSPGPALGPAGNAEALLRELPDLDGESLTVVGHSYGGAVAVALALACPERVASLVLLAPAVTRSAMGVLDRAFAAPILGEVMAWASVGVVGRLARRRREWSWQSFVIEQRAILDEIDGLEAGLSSIAAPTVVVAGAWDRVVPARATAEVSARIPGCELVRVPRVGHLLPMQAPARVVEVIVSRMD